MKRLIFAQCIAWAAIISHSAHAITVPTVPVGNVGNSRDPNTGDLYGSVGYVYNIGKYEVTAGQYTAFLNAVADADPNGLYNTRMGDPAGSNLGANIQRSGSSPNFSYSVAADWANRPVNYVSFWDAARFANWLHNGQPTGPQGPGTTEGGAYHNVGSQALFGRNSGALFFIPTYDEWYKAAYHKNDGITSNYWKFATQSDTPPINTLPDPGNHANYYDSFGTGNHDFTIGRPYFRTEVGAFENSPSPYGTFDQAGNVFEWNETAESGLGRGLHGGSFNDDFDTLSSALYLTGLGYFDPTLEDFRLGFRVASIPEPGSITLWLSGALVLALRRRR